MSNLNLLKPGDVIEIKKGMKVYAGIPQKFVKTFGSNRKTEAVITVGEVKTPIIPSNHFPIAQNTERLDTSIYEGKYMVYFAGMENSTNKYRIFCEKQDNSREILSFYQTGSASAKIKNIAPINR